MRSQVVWVDQGPEAFAELFEQARVQELRVGWLAMVPAIELPPAVAAPLEHGAWRAAAVSARDSVSAKRRRGAPVLRDLLRELFLGCDLVLVRADTAPPGAIALRTAGGNLVLVCDDRRVGSRAADLCLRVRQPGFWRRLSGRQETGG